LVAGIGAETRARLARHRELILTLARAERVEEVAEPPSKGAVQLVVDDATIALPLAEVIDLAGERARLEKEIGRLAGEIAKVEKKLSNPEFVAKAPPEIVEEQTERRDDWVASRDRLVEALGRLAAI